MLTDAVPCTAETEPVNAKAMAACLDRMHADGHQPADQMFTLPLGTEDIDQRRRLLLDSNCLNLTFKAFTSDQTHALRAARIVSLSEVSCMHHIKAL